jgi:hypothetical protein
MCQKYGKLTTDCLNPSLGFQWPLFWSQPSDNISPIIILLTRGVNWIRDLSKFVNFCFKNFEVYPNGLSHKVSWLQEEVIVFVE